MHNDNYIKEKKHFGPKPKGGGTTNKAKLKSKPLMMIRPKKNKEKLNSFDSMKK